MAEIEKSAVIGAGLMGSGIAQVLAQAGIEVKMVDVDNRYLEHAFESIKKSLGIMTDKGKMTNEEADKVLSRIKGTLDCPEVGSWIPCCVNECGPSHGCTHCNQNFQGNCKNALEKLSRTCWPCSFCHVRPHLHFSFHSLSAAWSNSFSCHTVGGLYVFCPP